LIIANLAVDGKFSSACVSHSGFIFLWAFVRIGGNTKETGYNHNEPAAYIKAEKP